MMNHSSHLLNEETVATNQNGRLTPSQLAMLQPYSTVHVGLYLFYGFNIILVLLMLNSALDSFAGGPVPPEARFWYTIIFGTVILFCLISILYYMYKARTLKQDLDNPKIARGTGRVRQRWSNYYTAEVDNIRLNDPSYVFDLPPGQYTFYYLPKSRKLLSATPLAPNNHETHLKLFAQDLQKKFHFNDQDLAINHNNQLSTKQKLLMLIPITGYTVGIILILIISVASIANPPNESYIGILIFSLFMLLIIWVLFDDLQKLVTDWYTGTVLSIVGPLKTRTKGGVRHRTYYFVIDDKEFEVSATKFGMAIKGINYRIYYTPYAHRLVAIEPLSIIP